MPSGADEHRDQDRRHEHQHEPDAVDSQCVVDAEGLDPGDVFDELPAAAGLVAQADDCREDERDDRHRECQQLAEVLCAPREERQHDGPEQRQARDNGQPGKVVHDILTNTSDRVTSAAPANIVSA